MLRCARDVCSLESLFLHDGRGGDGEVREGNYARPQVSKRYARPRVGVEDATEDGIEFVGEREDGAEEGGIVEVGEVGFILQTGPLPWVAPAGQVDEDDTEGPDVVGEGGVGGGGS